MSVKHEIVSVFLIDDGELHWIAARDEEEAKMFYQTLYEQPVDDEFEIRLVSNEELDKKMISTDDNLLKFISLKEVLYQEDTFPALLASSVW